MKINPTSRAGYAVGHAGQCPDLRIHLALDGRIVGRLHRDIDAELMVDGGMTQVR